MNAIDFLIKEHNRVRNMLEDISDDSHHYAVKKQKFDTLCGMLIRHEAMEHTEWYPLLKNKLPETIKHLISEENQAEKAINTLEALKTEEAWKTHFLKFRDDVKHHAEEEETRLFPEVQKILTKNQLEEIGQRMYVYKQKHPLN